MTAAVLDGFWRRPTFEEVAGLKPDGSPLPEYKATEALMGALRAMDAMTDNLA